MKKYFTLLIILLVAGVGAWYFSSHTPDEAEVTDSQDSTLVTYACNEDKAISAQYVNTDAVESNAGGPPIPTGSVMLELSDGRTMTLVQTISADGVRYANSDESFVFWSKGNGALVLENNEEKSYIGCIKIASEPEGQNLREVYSNSEIGFSLRYPVGYSIDPLYEYQLRPEETIKGVKFTIPLSMSEPTNLSSDTYLSVENIYQSESCTADLFLDGTHEIKEVAENGITYSVTTTSDAGAGNRYEETVYVLPGTNPCVGIRYFVHYSVFENYEPGTIEEFDKEALLAEFDAIRDTLVINQ